MSMPAGCCGERVSPRGKAILQAALTVALAAVVIAFVARKFADVSVAQVAEALASLPKARVAAALALAVFCYAMLMGYELLSQAYVGHALPARAVMATAFVAYAFNFNFGSLFGAWAMRFRLYAGQGLSASDIGKVAAMSVVTSWLGYCLVAGAGLALLAPPLPEAWSWPHAELVTFRPLGVTLLGVGAAYVATCALRHGRGVHWRRWRLRIPTWRFALRQAGLSSAYWLAAAGVIFCLLPPSAHVTFGLVFVVYALASVAGAVAHIPANLGVLEGVFLAFLASRVPPATVLASLLAFRGLYFIAPLLAAAVAFAIFEWRRHHGKWPGLATKESR